MSGSAALEYGFPSTHSTNAVSVALYSLLVLRDNPSIPDDQRIIYIVLAALYATSIVFGRVYCGMHGFLDVVVGSILGVILALAEWVYGPLTNQWVWYGTWVAPVTMTLAILMFVRIHPEPADPCPCFDDGVAFAGVVVGIEVGQWHYSKTSFGWNTPVPATVPYSFSIRRVGINILEIRDGGSNNLHMEGSGKVGVVKVFTAFVPVYWKNWIGPAQKTFYRREGV